MSLTAQHDMNSRQLALIRNTVAKDCKDDEFNLFCEAARSYGLDPFRSQVIPLVFGKANDDRRRMSIVVTRDGLRVIASRCKDYRPASEPAEITYDEEAKGPNNPKGIVSARVKLWKQDNRGDWYPVIGEADWDEFAPLKEVWAYDKEEGKRQPTGRFELDRSGNWPKMPKTMITKCAEAQALRAGWPEEFSGLYVEAEMDKAVRDDQSASDRVAHEAEQRRLTAVGADDSITVFWGEGYSLENVPVGQFFDRADEFIRESEPREVSRWADANRAGLQMYWAKAPGDALELKKRIEGATKQVAA